MFKLEFLNANVSDHGYGLEINGTKLEETITRILGAKTDRGWDDKTAFKSNSCDVVVIITPHPVEETITVNDAKEVPLKTYIEEMEGAKVGNEKAQETDPEE